MKKFRSEKPRLPVLFPVILIMAVFPLSNILSEEPPVKMTLASPAFPAGGMIPRKYLLRGGNLSPPLIIGNIPSRSRSLALVLDDPDAPRGTWVHWVQYDIPITGRIEAGTSPGTEGINDFRRTRYDGPAPPSGTHRYVFTIYALDRMLGLRAGADKEELEKATRGHILGRARLVGLCRSER